MLTTGDPGLVARHREQFWEQINSGSVDVLCANRCTDCFSDTVEHPMYPSSWKAISVQVLPSQQPSSSWTCLPDSAEHSVNNVVCDVALPLAEMQQDVSQQTQKSAQQRGRRQSLYHIHEGYTALECCPLRVHLSTPQDLAGSHIIRERQISKAGKRESIGVLPFWRFCIMDVYLRSWQAATSYKKESLRNISKRREEGEQLLGRQVTAAEAALELGSLCSVAAITDGPNGSYISALGRLQVRHACLCAVHGLHVLLAGAVRTMQGQLSQR